MTEQSIERARLLLQVDRHEDAARELTRVLAAEPENPEAHTLFALAAMGAKRFEEATDAARRAVGLAPDWPHAHYVLGAVLCDRNREKEALASAREAVRLDPEDPDHHALEAACHAGTKRWKDMRAAAERALELDPTHVWGLNLRAGALRQLGELDAAAEALDYALAEDPEDSNTHTSYGFAALQRGQVHDALQHFREALRLEPENETARVGLAEALKARNPLYRPILWWMFWSSKLTGGSSLLVVFGLMFGMRALAKNMPENGALSVVFLAVIALYVLAVWTSWVGSALFDFLLWLRRDTRDVLLPRDRTVAVCVGATVAAAPLAGALVGFTVGVPQGLLAAAAFLAVAIPVAGGLSLPNAKARFVGAAVALVCVLLSVAGTLSLAFHGRAGDLPATEVGREQSGLGLGLLALALVAARLSTWLLVFLGLVKERR